MPAPGLILDAIVALSWAFEDETQPYTEAVLEALAHMEALAPSVWALEVGNGLLAAERRGRLNQAASVQFLALLRQLPITLEDQKPDHLVGEIISLARERRLSTYDAAYLHLAMDRGLPLATLDGALRQAAAEVGVELFGESTPA